MNGGHISSYLKLFILLAAASFETWAQTGYSGPQVLSRGGVGNVGQRAGQTAGFSYYGGISGTYEVGYVPPVLDSSGQIIDPGELTGVVANFGAYGRKAYRRTTVGLDYFGNYRHYTNNSFYNGSDHVLTLALAHQISRRVRFFSQTAAGTISRYYSMGATLSDFEAVPAYGVFDNRVYYLQTNTGFQWQPTARLYMSGSGTGFAVRRQSSSLVGVNGYGGQFEMGYRLSRTKTIQGSTMYSHYDYPRGFGETDLVVPMIGWQQRIGRRWELGINGGIGRIRTIGVERIAADPLTAALFGTSTTVRAFNRTVNMATVRAQLEGRFRRSSVSFAYQDMPNPGNGVYLTSKQSMASGTFGYTVLRRSSLSVSMSRSSVTSVGPSQLGTYRYTGGAIGFSHKLMQSLEATASYDVRQININNGFDRLSQRVMFGVNYNPREFPISFW